MNEKIKEGKCRPFDEKEEKKQDRIEPLPDYFMTNDDLKTGILWDKVGELISDNARLHEKIEKIKREG